MSYKKGYYQIKECQVGQSILRTEITFIPVYSVKFFVVICTSLHTNTIGTCCYMNCQPLYVDVSNVQRGGGGSNGPPTGFSDLEFEAFKQLK